MIIENRGGAIAGSYFSVDADEMLAMMHYAMNDPAARTMLLRHMEMDEAAMTDEKLLERGYFELAADGVMTTDYSGSIAPADLNRDSPVAVCLLVRIMTVLSSLSSLLEIRMAMGTSISSMMVVSDGDAWAALWKSHNRISVLGGFGRDDMPGMIWGRLEKSVKSTKGSRRDLIMSFSRYDTHDKVMLGTSLFGSTPTFNEPVTSNVVLATGAGDEVIDGLYTYASTKQVKDRVQEIIEVI